ncbi:hypothetical protein CXF72_04900 [Psychromonas sp. MB-3u-54]|nr:hypothetical protein CXF72_04900 [Psychromonas sp. MB-3u-54]
MPGADFNHQAHLRLAYVYLVDNDTDSSMQRMKMSLKRFIEHNRIDPTKYHETITTAWVLVVNHFMNKSEGSNSADQLMSQNPEMLEEKTMMTHYSAEVLFSNEARNTFVEPNLAPIPRHKD